MELLASPPFDLPKTFEAVDNAIESNADIAESVLAVGLDAYGLEAEVTEWKGVATPKDMDKTRSTIRQLYRDWSEEGASERQACYGPIVAALNNAWEATPIPNRSHLKVLVPGAGLGRLAYELCKAGYAVEGNEISYHQLLVSNWVLNGSHAVGAFQLYPWALSFSNHLSRSNQLQMVPIPDVVPGRELDAASKALSSDVHAFERMSMTSGDFCVLYKDDAHKGAFDSVVTCFFIDTAPNLISYVETVDHCLRSGGTWVNLGPLLWHFEGEATPNSNGNAGKVQHGHEETSSPENQGIGESGSFELTEDEVVHLLNRYDLEVVVHDTATHATGYIQDPRSMLQNTYRPSCWTARKR